MSKLQVNLLSVRSFVSNVLKVKLSLNECIGRGPDGELISIGLHNGNLYEMNFNKVHKADTANLIQS